MAVTGRSSITLVAPSASEKLASVPASGTVTMPDPVSAVQARVNANGPNEPTVAEVETCLVIRSDVVP